MKPIRTLIILSLIGISPVILSSMYNSYNDREALLTDKPWIFNARLETRVGNGQWKVTPSSKNACDKDDLLLFGSHNTYEITFGKIHCNGENKAAKSGTWLITSKGKLLMDDYSLDIDVLNEDTLQVTRKSGQYQDRYTYLHK